MLSQCWRDIALHHLHVVDVILNKEIIRLDIGDDLNSLLGPAQKEAGNIECVDRLDQKANTLPREGVRSESQIVQEHLIELDQVRVSRRDTDETIHLTAIES